MPHSHFSWCRRALAFGLGTVTGMTALTLLIAEPLQASKPQQAQSSIQLRLDKLEQQVNRDLTVAKITAESATMNFAEQKDTQLREGWIVRVFPSPYDPRAELDGMDVGQFLLDELRFGLSAHEGHLIDQPRLAAYRMNALYRARAEGRHQFGISVNLANRDREEGLEIPVCHFRLWVKDKAIFERRVRFDPGMAHAAIEGHVDLAAGLHHAEITIACDLPDPLSGRDLGISIGARAPGKDRIEPRRGTFLHLEKI